MFSRKLINIALVLGMAFAGSPVSAASGASLQFTPDSGTFYLGSTFNVSFLLNTNGKAVNAIEIKVKFPPDKLQVANPSIGTSFISIWITPPAYSNTEGSLEFRGGVPSPGVITSNGVISTATFRAADAGEAEIEYLATSQVLANDGKGTDILTTRGKARFTIAIPPPEGPEVYSPTHPDPNSWYRANDASFYWKKDENVNGFSYALSQDPFDIPDTVSEGEKASALVNHVEDGVWYFHLRALAGGSWGGVTHYLIRVDQNPPASFTIRVQPPSPLVHGTKPTISFLTTDATSIVDHYQLRIVQLDTADPSRSASFFTEEVSPYLFPMEESGIYQVMVRAFDRAGNAQDSATKIEILPAQAPRATREGFRIFSYFIAWKWLYLLLGILLLILLILAMIFRRKHRQKHEEMRQDLSATEREILDQYHGMFQRARGYRKGIPPEDDLPTPPDPVETAAAGAPPSNADDLPPVPPPQP